MLDSTTSKNKLLEQLNLLTDLKNKNAISEEEYAKLRDEIMEKLNRK